MIARVSAESFNIPKRELVTLNVTPHDLSTMPCIAHPPSPSEGHTNWLLVPQIGLSTLIWLEYLLSTFLRGS